MVGDSVEKWKLDFIREWAGYLTAEVIANRIGMSTSFVFQYAKFMGLSMTRTNKRPPPEKRIIYLKKKEKEPLVRPPAKYDNVSREEVIEKYLNA
jgi:hypothetical protein